MARGVWMPAEGIVPSAEEKAAITAACERLIAEVLKPRFLTKLRPTEFNYAVDIYGKWHGRTAYRFIQRYRSGFPENRGQEFEHPFTRIQWVKRDRFDISYMRHTGKWHCLYQDVPLEEALRLMQVEPVLQPT